MDDNSTKEQKADSAESMEKPVIGIGYRFGMLTIEAKAGVKNGHSLWKCRCDCGREVFLDTRYIRRQTITDCGCKTKVKPGMLDLTGMRFGRLVCLYVADEKDSQGNTQWVCKCDCGNTCIAALPQKKSCGCISKE